MMCIKNPLKAVTKPPEHVLSLSDTESSPLSRLVQPESQSQSSIEQQVGFLSSTYLHV